MIVFSQKNIVWLQNNCMGCIWSLTAIVTKNRQCMEKNNTLCFTEENNSIQIENNGAEQMMTAFFSIPFNI